MGVISNDGYIGIAKQAAKGSFVMAPDVYVKYQEDTFQPENEVAFLREGGDDELIGAAVKNMHLEKWGFKCLARPDITAYLIAWLLGADDITGTGDPFTHVFTRDVRDWLTIRRLIAPGQIQILTDAKIESITFEMEAGKEVVLTVEGNALSAKLDTTVDVPSYDTGRPFTMYHGNGRFKFETSINSSIRKLTVKIMVASQEGMQTDDLVLNDLPDLKLDVDVSTEVFVDNIDFWKKSIYNNLTVPDEGVYSGAIECDLRYKQNEVDDRQLKINIAKFFWAPVTGINLKGEPEVMVQTLAGPMAKPAAGEPITVTIKNSIADDLT